MRRAAHELVNRRVLIPLRAASTRPRTRVAPYVTAVTRRARPRVLVLSRLMPYPPSSGEHMRNWANIRALGRLATVDVVSMFGDRPRPWFVPGLCEWRSMKSGRVDGLHWNAADRFSLFYEHIDVTEGLLERLVRRLQPDLVVLEQLGMHIFVPALRKAGCRVVLDAHNVEGQLFAQMGPTSETPGYAARVAESASRNAVAELEAQVMRTVDEVWTCSAHDAQQVVDLYGLTMQPRVVPNVVDFDAYRASRAGRARLSADGPVVMFPALFNYKPNEDAALWLLRDIFPALRERFRKAELLLVGKSPTPAIEALADPGVTITGRVESVTPYLARATVMAIPLAAGSGTRFKAVEAFAAGLPVVSTAKGVEGLELEDRVHFLAAETTDGFVDAIARLHEGRDEAIAIARAAYRLGRERYSMEALERALAEALTPRPPLTASRARGRSRA